jgi:hypothetical protein
MTRVASKTRDRCLQQAIHHRMLRLMAHHFIQTIFV